MVRPDRHRCCDEVRRKGLHGYDKSECLLLDRTVIPLGGSKLAAQVANRMFYIIHNLEQNCTQTSLGSINCYRKRQVIIGWSQYWTGAPQRPTCTSPRWGVNSQVGECLVGLDHQGGRSLTEEPPRALREVERLTRNPEKLANASFRGWKDTLGRKRSFGTHRPPYPPRRGLVTTWQETKKLLHDDGFE